MKIPPPPISGLQLNLLEVHWFTPVNWNYSDLRAPYWRLYWNASPGMSLRYKGKEIPLTPDRIFLIPPETPFAACSEREACHFYVHFVTSSVWSQHEPHSLAIAEAQQRFLSALVQSDPSSTPRWKIMALVAECLEQLPTGGWGTRRVTSERIRSAMEIIEAQLPRAVAIHDLARLAGMNINAFIRLFREEAGATPGAYVMERRITTACLLLHHTDRSIERIAEECGFCDRHHFSRAFAQCRGVPPAAFRQYSRHA